MANNISGAGLSGIYNRLNGISQYHPLETETFSDWSTEAGDIVKVKRGDEEYDSPVHTSRMVWRGTPQMSLSSTGNQKRDAIAKVSKKKYRGGSGGLRNEEYIYKEFTSSDGMLWSSIFMSESRLQTIFTNGFTSVSSQITQTAEVINASVWGAESSIYSELKMTATYIMSEVGNIESDVQSRIVQKANEIYSEVYAANSTLYTHINQTATNISSRVEDVNRDLHSEIEQTQSMIRSSVWTANSTIWTEIQQTASYILDHVGARTGAKVMTGTEPPQDTPSNPLTPGDLWVEGTLINTWDDFSADYPWEYDEYDWEALSGQKVHVWRDGKWNLVEDGTKLVEDTWLLRTESKISMVAKNVEKIDGEFRTNLGKLEVKADIISSTVTQHGRSIGELGSNITQTARDIRAEVHAANSTLYSYVDQTATYIRSYVADEINDMGSEILQTASQIRAEVHAANSTLYSYVDQTATYIRSVVTDTANGLSSSITQTASSIRSEVANSISRVNSTITQTANQIRSEVNAANSAIYSSITQTASSIRLEVKNAISGVNSSITQTASQIRSEVNAANSTIYSSITQNANKIALVVESTASGNKIKPASIVAAINNGGSSVVISANHINLDGYVKTTDLDTDWLTSKIASVTGSISGNLLSFNEVDAGTFKFRTGSGTYHYSDFKDIFVTGLTLTQSGNTYTLKSHNYNQVDTVIGSFSRAVSRWEWTGGNGQVKATAQPQDQTLGIDVRVSGNATITSNGTYTYKAQYEDNNGSYWDIGGDATKSITVSVPSGQPTRNEIWLADDSQRVHGNYAFKKGGMSIHPWVEVGGQGYYGDTANITDPYTDKGSNWSCTYEDVPDGGRYCKLTKYFGASQSIPFSNGNSYHLYT